MPKVSPRAKSHAPSKPTAGRSRRPGRKLSHAAAKTRIRAGRQWSRRLLLHPMAVFGILVTGVCLAGLTYRASAIDYTVTATVAAASLTQGAVITSPVDGAVINSEEVEVSGTCPDEAYVKLFRNSVFSGVDICHGGKFHINTSLFEGQNNLQAQDYNITDVAGPVTDIVQVTYQPPGNSGAAHAGAASSSGADQTTVTSAAPGSKLAVPAVPTAPPLLTSDYHFSTATTQQDFMWQMQFQDGQAPFSVGINWGDSKNSALNVVNNDAFTITHHYEKAGFYTVQVKATDAQERTVDMQLVALIRRPGDSPIRGAILSTTNQDNGGSRLHWLAYIWPTYLVIAALVASFWLGERREYLVLTARAAKPARPRLRHS